MAEIKKELHELSWKELMEIERIIRAASGISFTESIDEGDEKISKILLEERNKFIETLEDI